MRPEGGVTGSIPVACQIVGFAVGVETSSEFSLDFETKQEVTMKQKNKSYKKKEN